MNKLSPVLAEQLRMADLEVETYTAATLPEPIVDQLVVKSRQPHIMQFEGREDAYGRFKDADAFAEWAEGKERIFYVLLGKPQDAGGVIWFGRKDHNLAPGFNLTFSVRLYDEDKSKGWSKYVGKGLARPFMYVAHNDVARFYPDERVWLDLAEANHGAYHVYESAGYSEIARAAGRIVMGRAEPLAYNEPVEL